MRAVGKIFLTQNGVYKLVYSEGGEPVPATQPLSNLENNALLRDPNTKMYDEPIIWTIVDKGHTGYPVDSITLRSKYLITVLAFDAREATNPNNDRKNYGNNRYSQSNIRQWLNSDALGGNWFTAQNPYDVSPSASVLDNGTGYISYSGFLQNLSQGFKNALMQTALISAVPTSDGGSTEPVIDKVFLPSGTEVGFPTAIAPVTEGFKFPTFSGSGATMEIPLTQSALDNYSYRPPLFVADTTTPNRWALRTPVISTTDTYMNGFQRGTALYGPSTAAIHGGVGISPFVNISKDTQVTEIPDSDGIYTIIW